MLPQDETERILFDRLAADGGTVYRGVAATAITQEGDGAMVTVAAEAGETTIRARYVIGADGMHSVVRSATGTEFQGGTFSESFVLADVRLDWSLGASEVSLFFAPAGLVVIAPMPDGVFRVVATVSQAPEQPAIEDIQGLIDARGPRRQRTVIKELLWSSRFRIHHRVAKSYRSGRLARQSRADQQFAGFVPRLQSLAAEMNRDGNRILFPLLGAAILVLLIACGNVAALLLVRGLQRHQEYAVRSALGVGKIALFRQVSTESLLLSLGGGMLGTALAVGAVQAVKAMGSHAIPRLDAVVIGWPILAFGLTLAAATALSAGLIPALRASRLDPMQAIKSGGPNSSAGRTERRLLRGVTVAQTALTLALLVGAGLMIRTMRNVGNIRAGYDTARVLTMSVTAVQGNGPDFHRRALERVSALPGVEHAAFAWGVPLTGNNWPGTVDIEGQPAPAKPSDRTSIPLRSVTPGYFEMLGQSVARGRDFRSTDVREAPRVIVVNQALATRYFPQSTAIGRKIWLFGREQPPAEIVGVATNGRTDDLTQPAGPEIYVSFWQMGAFSKHLAVRTAVDPSQIAGRIQAELRAVDPTVAVENIQTLDQIRSHSLAPRNFAMQLLLGFAAMASILTLVGIYGVLALSVASRRREIAIRSAIGADAQAIRRMVLSEGLVLIATGVAAGLGAALLLSRVLRTFLFGVEPADPVTFGAAGLLFALAAIAACWTPALRAARVNPIDALRQD